MRYEGPIWITGASSGIGRALCKELSARGATLVLTARRSDELQAVKAECAIPERAHVLAGDLLDADSRADLATRAAELAGGPIQVLVNNAGLSQRALAEQTHLSDVRRMMELNFFAPVELTIAVLPAMRTAGKGRVVIISSVAGYVGTPLRSTYAASKHAVRGYYDSLRAELHGSGVGVTVVCPGYVKTAISENAVGADGQRHGRADAVFDKGISAEACARRIADAIEAQESELLVGGKETLAVYAKRFVPRLIERLVPGQAPK